jgi:hypothetical protein
MEDLQGETDKAGGEHGPPPAADSDTSHQNLKEKVAP